LLKPGEFARLLQVHEEMPHDFARPPRESRPW
jgi:hypothetical protein